MHRSSLKKYITLILSGLLVSMSFARGSELESTQFLHDTASQLSLILDVIYVILWPLIFIAGWALDNTLVLGEVFHMDKVLRDFWNIMRNLANYSLGFIMIYMVMKNLRGGNDNPKDIVGIISKALVAGVGIQVSWFLMITLIDISTIVIYSVGSMPLQSMPEKNTEIPQHRIIQPVIVMNNAGIDTGTKDKDASKKKTTSKTKDENKKKTPKKFFSVNYTCNEFSKKVKVQHGYDNIYTLDKDGKNKKGEENTKERSIKQCIVHNNFLISFRPDEYYEGDDRRDNLNTDPINYEYCVYNREIYQIAENIHSNDNKKKEKFYYIPLRIPGEAKTEYGTPSKYKGENQANEDFFTKFNKDNKRYIHKNFKEKADEKEHKESFRTIKKTEDFCTTTFKTLSETSHGIGGSLTAMFSSILQFSDLTLFNNDNIARLTISFFIRVILAIMLFIPLVVLAIVLIKRVGYLRIALVGSPFIILIKAFGKDLGIDLDGDMEIFNLEKVIGLIFMPAITVFALSIGIVFLSALQSTLSTDKDDSSLSQMGITKTIKETTEGNTTCYDIFMANICYESDGQNGDGRGNFLDYFSWTMMMLFGVGVMWMIVFASFKASSISSNLAGKVQSLAQKAALSTPILPIGGGTSLASLGIGKGHTNQYAAALGTSFSNKISEQNTGISNMINKKPNTTKGSAKDKRTLSGTAIEPFVREIKSSAPAASVATGITDNLNLDKNSLEAKKVRNKIRDTKNQDHYIIMKHEDKSYRVTNDGTSKMGTFSAKVIKKD